jgi:hypothetical protein
MQSQNKDLHKQWGTALETSEKDLHDTLAKLDIGNPLSYHKQNFHIMYPASGKKSQSC